MAFAVEAPYPLPGRDTLILDLTRIYKLYQREHVGHACPVTSTRITVGQCESKGPLTSPWVQFSRHSGAMNIIREAYISSHASPYPSLNRTDWRASGMDSQNKHVLNLCLLHG